MQIEILVDQEEYWPRLEADIASARDHVYVQTLSFEGDRVGKAISQCMRDCPAVDRRLIADDVHVHHRINDKYLHSLKHRRNMDIRRERDETLRIIDTLRDVGVRVLLTNRAGPFTLNSFQRNHKKMIVVDDRVAYIGGVNFSEHNFAWHDMMLRIESTDVATLLKADFRSTWAGSHRAGAHDFEGLSIHLMDGHTNRAAFRPILELIASARESVYVESPYITYPFYDALRRARRAGAHITLVTPELNNWRALQEYAVWESMRGGFDVRLYPQRMTHLKGMLVDDRVLIVGSSNFDFLSRHFMQEIVAVITHEEAVRQFKEKVVAPDSAASHPAEGTISNRKGYLHLVGFKLLTGGLKVLHALVPQRR